MFWMTVMRMICRRTVLFVIHMAEKGIKNIPRTVFIGTGDLLFFHMSCAISIIL